MDIVLLLSLILFNGFFAMAEIALVTARRGRLRQLADTGDRGAARAIELNENPIRFLSTIQIGITSIGVLSGIVGEATLAQPLALWLQSLGAPPNASEVGATALVVVLITYFTIVLGELVPKRIGQLNPEGIARFVAQPMLWLALIARPFVLLLSGSTELILRLLSVRSTSAQAVTEEEIHVLLEECSDAGVIERQEHDMMRNAIRLGDRRVASLMTPRSEIVYLDIDSPNEENLAKIRESSYSRYPVTRGGLRDVKGMIHVRQLLAQTLSGEPPNLSAELESAVYVPDGLTGLGLLDAFRSSQIRCVLVVDEYGHIEGLVTLQDLVEAIAGEFQTSRAEDSSAVQRPDGSWLLDGFLPVPELKDHLGLKAVPEEDAGHYHTLSGMVMLLVDRLPRTGDRVEWGGWSFEVVDMDGSRIDKVLAVRISDGVPSGVESKRPPDGGS
ncbi:MAG: HlyC/CorC family transporter [Chromatiales bacterium]|jgi:putative hemolysin|nr:MAG: HlyC/CorC family transporter [Chromatiales bacterium]